MFGPTCERLAGIEVSVVGYGIVCCRIDEGDVIKIMDIQVQTIESGERLNASGFVT